MSDFSGRQSVSLRLVNSPLQRYGTVLTLHTIVEAVCGARIGNDKRSAFGDSYEREVAVSDFCLLSPERAFATALEPASPPY
jgi:hypothetical protein